MPEEPIVMTEEDGQGGGVSTIAWFLTGAAIGVTVAVLFAPKSGRDTRRFLSAKTHEGKEAVAQTSSDIVDVGRDVFERGRKLVEDAAELFERGRRLVRG
ncbi:MAG: YtxH domain-containing protein [Bryobacteraceae bacterium]|jgi:gas vesicle protein